MRYATNRGKLFIRFVILLDFLCAMNLVVLSETTPSEGTVESTQSAVSYRAVFRPAETANAGRNLSPDQAQPEASVVPHEHHRPSARGRCVLRFRLRNIG